MVPLRAPITACSARLNTKLLQRCAGSSLWYFRMILGQGNNISAIMGHYSLSLNCLAVTLCVLCFIISCKFTPDLMTNDSQRNTYMKWCDLFKLFPIVSANAAHHLFWSLLRDLLRGWKDISARFSTFSLIYTAILWLKQWLQHQFKWEATFANF